MELCKYKGLPIYISKYPTASYHLLINYNSDRMDWCNINQRNSLTGKETEKLCIAEQKIFSRVQESLFMNYPPS